MSTTKMTPPKRYADGPSPRYASLAAGIGNALTVGVSDYCQRYADIATRYVSIAGETLTRDAVRIPDTRAAARSFLAEARNLAVEMMLAPGSAAVRAQAAFARGAGDRDPVMVDYDGQPVLLPVRIRDSSQGMAFFDAPLGRVQARLEAAAPGLLQAVDIGGGRGMVSLILLDCRASDLGAYHELGIAYAARPRRSGLPMPGLYVEEYAVDSKMSLEVGEQVWGYVKTMAEVDLTMDEQSARVAVARAGAPDVALTLPRGGVGRSTDVPLYTYSVLEGKLLAALFSRSGVGEQTVRGGDGVELALGDGPTAGVLRGLGLDTAVAIGHVWTETMTGLSGDPFPA